VTPSDGAFAELEAAVLAFAALLTDPPFGAATPLDGRLETGESPIAVGASPEALTAFAVLAPPLRAAGDALDHEPVLMK
jgi:hypothetical protein